MINQTYQRRKVLEITVHYKLIDKNRDAMQVVWPSLFRDVRVASKENPLFALEELKKKFFVKHPHPFQEFKSFAYAPLNAIKEWEKNSSKSSHFSTSMLTGGMPFLRSKKDQQIKRFALRSGVNCSLIRTNETKSPSEASMPTIDDRRLLRAVNDNSPLFLNENVLNFLESPLESKQSRDWIANYCNDKLGEVSHWGNIRTSCYPEECSDLHRGEYISFEILNNYNAHHAEDMLRKNKEKLFLMYEDFLRGNISDELVNANGNHLLIAHGEFIAAEKTQNSLITLVEKLNFYPTEYHIGEFTDRNYMRLYRELCEQKNVFFQGEI